MQRVDTSHLHHKKAALVLSGGVVKAASWHLGVALALEELGFTFKSNESASPGKLEISTYVGSSAGALVNLYFASGFRPMEVIEATVSGRTKKLRPVTYKDLLWLKRPSRAKTKRAAYRPFEEFPSFLKLMLNPILKISGLFSTQGLKRYIEKYVLLAKSFEDYQADLFIVATQLDNSRKVIFSKYLYPGPPHDPTTAYHTGVNIADSVAASMSVPPFYSPFPVENPLTKKTEYYIDGEIRETLSTHAAIDNKCKVIISSWTHTPYHYHQEIGSLINYGLPAICTQAIFLMVQKKIVTSRTNRKVSQDIVDTVNDYMKTHKFSDEHRLKLLNILERKLNFDPDIQLIDIYPSPNNHRVFFQNPFSLRPEKASEIVSLAYKKTIEVFKRHCE